MILLKINEQGVILDSFEHDSDDTVYSGLVSVQLENGDYLVGGLTLDTPNGELGGALMKVNSTFQLDWMKTYTGAPYEEYEIYSIVETDDGGALLGFRKTDFSSFNECLVNEFDIDPLLIKVDSLGNEIWRKTFGTCRAEGGAQLSQASDGNYLLASNLQEDEPAVSDVYLTWPYLAKLDPAGEVIWERTYGESNFDCVLTKVHELSDGNIISGGFKYDAGINTAHRWGLMIKVNQNGDSLWYRQYKFADDTQCFFRDVVETPDGGFAACGRTWPSEGQPSIDAWVVKTDEYGCIIPGCHIGVEEFTEKYGSFKVGPNPVSQSENLVVFLPNVKDLSGLSFQLRNLSGQLVKSFTPDEGGTSYLLGMDDFAKGMYVLSLLKDGTVVQSEKVVVR